jgi:hypothetical protein
MEWNVLIEQEKQVLDAEDVQTSKETVEKPLKKRSQEDKVGRIKYQSVLLKEVKGQNEQILTELRWVRHRLEKIGEASYDSPTVESFAVVDQIDREILQRVREVGDAGVFPKDVADWVNKIGAYGLEYYDVSRRIVRMNKRLHFETGKFLFEKRGHRWALTKFGFDVYGATKDEAGVDDAQAEVVEDEEES